MAGTFNKVRTQIAVKVEATEGTAETPADADVIHPIYDPEWVPDIENPDRNALQASLSKETKITGKQMAAISFSTELKGSGTAGTPPSHLDALLKAVGFAVTNVPSTSDTYDLASASVGSFTVELREGDDTTNFKSHKISGARANMVVTCVGGTDSSS